MEYVKTQFSIKDLEHLSGIKSHTLRIWEKRYNLLVPNRTKTNIRYYDIQSLQKLLNVTLLYNNGYKISKIAEMPEESIPILVREIASKKNLNNRAVNTFKLAMLNFDQSLFSNTYNKLLSDFSFREIFYNVFIPLLEDLGMLWQTNTITPAHEHFISSLVKQKIIINTERLHVDPPKNSDKVFVLYLPENEIHEIGLLYLNYELLLNGYYTIYLGQTIPIDSLIDFDTFFSKIHYISYFTVEPQESKLDDYFKEFEEKINIETHMLSVLGYKSRNIEDGRYSFLSTFSSISDFIKNI